MTARSSFRRVAVALGTGAAVAVLAACAPELPTPEPDPVPAAVQPAVSTDQVDDVLADLAATLEAADAAGQADLLDPRVTGPARVIREAQYVFTAAGDAEAVTTLPPAAQTIVAPATAEWPRTVMVVTQAPEDLQAPLLLTLVQESPREQYRLWSWARLFPGVQVPATAQPQVGSAPIEADSTEVTVPPGEVIARYVDVLTQGAASPHAALFAEDPLRAGIVALRDALTAGVVDKGTLTETYQVVEGGPYAIGTADGGAIVVAAFETLTTITLSDSTLTFGDETAALLGKDTITTSLATSWMSTVAFHVPPAGSTEPVQVLGAEHSRVQVTGE